MTLGTKIVSLDYKVAENIINNNDLEKILNTSDEWITTRTGIKTRYVLDDNKTSCDLAIDATKKVIKRANYNPENIDLIIAASSAPEIVYPSVSCAIQNSIGAKNAACFDLKAACAGLVYSLHTAQAFIKSRIYKNILIVATDATSKFIDWSDRSTCVLFGDGAGAILLEADDNDDTIIGVDLFADGTYKDYITLTTKGSPCPLIKKEIDKTKPFIQMKGKEVYKYVMNEIPPRIESLIKRCNLNIENIDYFIPHQSNQKMIKALAERLSLDKSKIISNIEYYGNMSAASVIVAIRDAIDKQKLKLPATLLLSTFGAGMVGGNAIIKLKETV